MPRVRPDGEAHLSVRVVPGLHEGQGPRGPRSRGPDGQRLAERFGIRRVPSVARPHPRSPPQRQAGGSSSQAAWMERFVASERGGPTSAGSSTRKRRPRPTRRPRSPSARRLSAAAGTRWRRSDSGASPATGRPRPTSASGPSPTSPRSPSRPALRRCRKGAEQLLATTKDPALMRRPSCASPTSTSGAGSGRRPPPA